MTKIKHLGKGSAKNKISGEGSKKYAGLGEVVKKVWGGVGELFPSAPPQDIQASTEK